MTLSNHSFLSLHNNTNHNLSRINTQFSDAKKTKEVAQEFESLFVEMMFKEMRKNLNKSNIFSSNSPETDLFTDLLYTEYSKISVQNQGFGIAQIIQNSLHSS